MGLFDLVLHSVVYFLVVAIDITVFFVLVRLVVSKWNWKWLQAFDRAGQQVIESLFQILDWKCFRLHNLRIRDKAKLCLSLVALFIIRLFLVAFVS